MASLTTSSQTITRDELIAALAANVLSLYRSVMVANAGTFISLLRKDLLNPRPGDIVLDVHECWRPPNDRLAVLEHRLRGEDDDATVFVRRFDGHYDTWRHTHLIKVSTRPFEAGEVS
jgi:hypothetical protein